MSMLYLFIDTVGTRKTTAILGPCKVLDFCPFSLIRTLS